MDAADAARRWVDGYARAWRTRDAERVAAMYAPGARYFSHPFRDAEEVLDYTRRNFAVEEDLEFGFGEPVAAGDRAAVEWWATLVEDGNEVTLAGLCLLKFDAEGRVVEHRDYWAVRDGRERPPQGLLA